METVEIIVYIGVAVVVGALLVAFIARWDARGSYEGFKGLFKGPDAEQYETISSGELARAALDLWDACGQGEGEASKTVYVEDAATLNKSVLFSTVKAASLCRTLQSAQLGCGSREDVVFANVTSPAVVHLRCANGTLEIVS